MMPSPEQKIAGTVPYLLQEIPGLPGSFRVQPGVEVKVGGQVVDTTAREVILDVFDPDLTGLPFHRSASFLQIPPELRLPFLLRNPEVTGVLIGLFNALHRLAQHYPKNQAILRADPDVAQVLERVDFLKVKYGIVVRWVDADASFLDPPGLYLWNTYPSTPAFAGKTVREQRRFRRWLAARRGAMGITAPRHRPTLEDYRKMLQVWDLHEGWTDTPSKGYDPEKSVPLKTAVSRIGVHREFYYRAFKFVTGEDYSIVGWERLFGIFWEGRRHFRAYKSRGTGRGSKKLKSTEQEAVNRFFELVRQGTAIPQAIAEAQLETFCNPETLRKLSDPRSYLDILRAAEARSAQ
jgi:hypothetical protein